MTAPGFELLAENLLKVKQYQDNLEEDYKRLRLENQQLQEALVWQDRCSDRV